MTSTCIIRFENTNVELCVTSDSSRAWRWPVSLFKGGTLHTGIATTQNTAQRAAQDAFEARLRRAELQRYTPGTYHWKRQVVE